jgi:hypothetical protein
VSAPCPVPPVGRKPGKRLTPSEKYEIYVAVLTGQATQREAAERFGVDRSTVVHICRVAKQGALDALAAWSAGPAGRVGRAGRTRRGAGGDRAAAGHGDRAGRHRASTSGKIMLGLTAGPVPPRVDATVKAGLLVLVEHARTVGEWSSRRAAATLGLDHTRLIRWSVRAEFGRLDDAKPGPDVPVHALLDWEREAIVTVAEQWGEIDRSHRTLAHRGCRLGVVHVSPPTGHPQRPGVDRVAVRPRQDRVPASGEDRQPR